MTATVELKVSESFVSDVSHGWARLNQRTMDTLNVDRGDIVSIEGDNKTAAMVWHAYSGDQAKDIVRIPSFVRHNGDLDIGQQVTIEKLHLDSCKKVVFSPYPYNKRNVSFKMNPEKTIRQCLRNKPLIKGHSVFIPGFKFLGSSVMVLFKIERCSPEGFVRMDSSTRVVVKH